MRHLTLTLLLVGVFIGGCRSEPTVGPPPSPIVVPFPPVPDPYTPTPPPAPPVRPPVVTPTPPAPVLPPVVNPPPVVEPLPPPPPAPTGQIPTAATFDSLVIGSSTRTQVLTALGPPETAFAQGSVHYMLYRVRMADGRIRDAELQFQGEILTSKIVGM